MTLAKLTVYPLKVYRDSGLLVFKKKNLVWFIVTPTQDRSFDDFSSFWWWRKIQGAPPDIIHARADTWVEPPTFRKPDGWLPHMKDFTSVWSSWLMVGRWFIKLALQDWLKSRWKFSSADNKLLIYARTTDIGGNNCSFWPFGSHELKHKQR